MAQVNYQEVGEQVTIARPSEALHKLRALVAAVRVVETYGEGGERREVEGRGGEGRGRRGGKGRGRRGGEGRGGEGRGGEGGEGRGGEGRGGEGRGDVGSFQGNSDSADGAWATPPLPLPPCPSPSPSHHAPPAMPLLAVPPPAVSIDLTHELTQALLQQTQPTDSQGRTTIAMLYANW